MIKSDRSIEGTGRWQLCSGGEASAMSRPPASEGACAENDTLRESHRRLRVQSDDPTAPLSRPRVVGPIAPGSQLGARYFVERIIGEGGMSTVYQATSEQDPATRVAIKVPRPQFSRTSD